MSGQPKRGGSFAPGLHVPHRQVGFIGGVVESEGGHGRVVAKHGVPTRLGQGPSPAQGRALRRASRLGNHLHILRHPQCARCCRVVVRGASERSGLQCRPAVGPGPRRGVQIQPPSEAWERRGRAVSKFPVSKHVPSKYRSPPSSEGMRVRYGSPLAAVARHFLLGPWTPVEDAVVHRPIDPRRHASEHRLKEGVRPLNVGHPTFSSNPRGVTCNPRGSACQAVRQHHDGPAERHEFAHQRDGPQRGFVDGMDDQEVVPHQGRRSRQGLHPIHLDKAVRRLKRLLDGLRGFVPQRAA